MARKKKSFMTPKASRRKARKRLSTTSARVKKEFTYRGFTMDELNDMPMWPENDEDDYIVGLLPVSAAVSDAASPSRTNTSSTEFFVPRPKPSVPTEETCPFSHSLLAEESLFTTGNISLKSTLSPK